jgi:glucosyl-dolichyl phosphate glucuronosyltransferase
VTAMKITVILCTYNRCQSLAKALESVAASELSDTIEWEVLVVDNNSRDQTRDVVEDFCRRYPARFRYLFEPRQGKSYALNSAVQATQAEILVFTDDDVIVEPTWLRNLTGALHEGKWAGSGGQVVPEESFSPPRWLALEGPYAMGNVLAFLEFGSERGEFTEDAFDTNLPVGANMAFRRAMFERYGGFRTDLGPDGSELRGEDTEFSRRLLKAGERLRHEPSAVVHHVIPQNRLRKEYFLAWWFGHGRTAVRRKGKRPPVGGIPRHYIGISYRILRILPGRVLRWMVALNPQRRFFLKCWVWAPLGEIVELYRQSFDARQQEQTSNLEPLKQ